MLRTVLLLALVAGCDDAGALDPEGEDTAPTGTEPTEPTPYPDLPLDRPPLGEPAGTVEASCVQEPDNVLRYDCHVAVDPPGPVTIELQKASGEGPRRTFHSSEIAAEHDLTLYLMAPRTEYGWRAVADDDPRVVTEGTFTTGVLPDAARVTFDIEGTASFPYFVAGSSCVTAAMVVIADTEGEVLWYHDFTVDFASFIDAVSFTEDGTVLAIVSSTVIEVDLLGRELMRLERFADFDEIVHHDAFRKDGLTWVLHKDNVEVNGDVFVMDGFYVFDSAGTLLADWLLADHLVPTGPTSGFGVTDYSHANAIWVGDDDDVYLSFRHLSGVAKVDGDLASPTFGDIEWRLSGDPDNTAFGSDFTLSAAPGVSPTFVQQHNVHLLPDGTLTLFDNRDSFDEESRLLHLSLDPALGTAHVDAAYQLPLHCNFQGGAWHTVGGNPVATCAPYAVAFEFDAGVTGVHRWSADMECFQGANAYVPRFVPLEESDL